MEGVEGTSALILGLLLLGIGATLAPVGVHVAEILVPHRRVFFARWGFSHLAIVVFTGMVLAFLFAATIDRESATLPLLWVNFALWGTIAGLCALVARRMEPDAWEALGLSSEGTGRAMLVGLVGFAFLFPALYGGGVLWPELLEVLGLEFEEQEVLARIRGLDGFGLLQAALVAVLLQPFAEELTFRGFLQPLLAQNLNDKLGILLTSLVFAALHGQAAFLHTFLLSLLIGGVMVRTHRLWAAFFVHALNNGLTLALAIYIGEKIP